VDGKFTVTIEGKFSEWKPVRAGVLQGTVLAPLLYNMYIHVADIPRMPGKEISQFANDTAAVISNKNIDYAVSNLQK
jgi:hypothetical protein